MSKIKTKALIEYFCFSPPPIKGQVYVGQPHIYTTSLSKARKIAKELYGPGCIVDEWNYKPTL